MLSYMYTRAGTTVCVPCLFTQEAIDAAWPPQEVVEHIESLKRVRD